MSLQKYKQMRDFQKTPEPAGKLKVGSSKSLRFVVHKHAARNLHYDLRLELGGVLLSWAVPKGMSLNPHQRRLAIHTEDHPLEYLKFEGTIPKGNYGAGKMTIWDHGTYLPRAQSSDAARKIRQELKIGHITFVLKGKKVNGEFALIKNEHIGKDAWLLIKKGDKYAKSTRPNSLDILLQSSRSTPMPKEVKPMLCTLVDAPFSNKDWLFEIKWDGFRAVLFWDQHKVSLRSRNNQDLTGRFDVVAKACEQIRHSVVLDGEIVAIDENGKPHFEWLQNNMQKQMGKLVYYVFDVLWYEGHDVTNWSLEERRKLLKKLLPKSQVVRLSEEVPNKGKELFAKVAQAGMEGIIAKKLGSTYTCSKRGTDWLKIKARKRQEVVIGGYTEPRGSRKNIGALLVGYYKDGHLHYCGHVGTGFNSATLTGLQAELKKLKRKTTPFSALPKANDVVHWVKPQVVCEVEYQELTREGVMRQASFLGLRVDKKAQDVVLENARKIGPSPLNAAGKVQLTHLDKVFWPKPGITKGDVLDYYRAVGPLILKYLKDRPESLLRQPDGIRGETFFQKDIGSIAPAWAKTYEEYSKTRKRKVTYLVANTMEAVEFMVQLGVIEINPWSSRVKKPNHPDWVVIDLDPEGVKFEAVIEVAQAVKAVCDELKINCYPKTSGKTGLHIYIPMQAKYTYVQAGQFAQILANLVHQRLPKITSLERSPKKRPHMVYLDYLQNHRGQTLAAPYCLRPSSFAGVSTPLEWREVKRGLKPEDFTIKTASRRFSLKGDLFAPVLKRGINLNAALKRAELLLKIDSAELES